MALFTRPSCRRLLALCMLREQASMRTPCPWLGAQPGIGDIVRIDPRSGAVFGAFPAPVSRCRETCMPARAWHTMERRCSILGDPLFDPDDQPAKGNPPWPGSQHRRDPVQVPGLQTTFGPDGIIWESRGWATFRFINHANPIPDIHRFENIEMPGMSIEQLFWGPTQGPDFYHSVGGLGGDGNGSEFGVFLDSRNEFGGHRFIGEYDPFVDRPCF